MAFQTSSISFPNMFNIATNSVAVVTDGDSVVNRTRLLLLTDTSELYNEPKFGAGLKQYLWQYNTSNVRAIMQDQIRSQLGMFEPCVDAANTTFSDTLITQDAVTNEIRGNQLNMTMVMPTIFNDTMEVSLDDIVQ